MVFFRLGNRLGQPEILVKENFCSEMNISKEREKLRKKQCLIASALDADLTVILRRNARCRKCGKSGHYAHVCKTTHVGLLVEHDNPQ